MVTTLTVLNTIRTNILTELNTNISHLAVGDSTTTPASSDTILGNETDRDALFSTAVQTTSDVSFEIFLDTTENNSNDIKELGSFDAVAGGNMYSRSLTNVISKTSSLEIFLVIKFIPTVSNA